MMASMHGIEIVDVPRGDPITEQVVVDGQHDGTVALRFPSSHLPTPEREARDALARTTLAGGARATVVALTVAGFLARGVVSPIHAQHTDVAAARSEERRGGGVN